MKMDYAQRLNFFADVDHAVGTLLLPMSGKLREIWERTDNGQPHKRRPSIGLKLGTIGASGLLSVAPGFDRRDGFVLPGTNHFELWLDRPDKPPRRVMKGSFVDDRMDVRRVVRADYVDHATIAAETLRMFLENRPEYIALMRPERCCLCRRPLRDPESLGRGFGPECVKNFG